MVASKGGAPQHPAWYLNLEANPDVDVQVKGDRMRARARTAREWPAYDSYQEKTDRDIPLVILAPER